jgi:hypothetical protein
MNGTSSSVEPTKKNDELESLAWVVRLQLVRRRASSGPPTPPPPPGPPSGPSTATPPSSTGTTTGVTPRDEVIFEVPAMEFAATWLKKRAPRHTLCAHPTDLSCMLIGRMREVASKHRTRHLTLERMGVPRRKGEADGQLDDELS